MQSRIQEILHYYPFTGYNEVMKLLSNFTRLAEFAEEQWGLVTRRQLENVAIPATTIDRLTAPGSVLERVAHGVYRLVGSPTPDHLELRAAWLQLAPGVPAWERTPLQGVVSHRSAAALYGVGDLPADLHDFTLIRRKQSRRPDVRLHRRHFDDIEWIRHRELPVTRPARIVSDLLYEHEDPGSVAQIIVDSISLGMDDPGNLASALSPHSARFGLRRDDGLALFRWLLDLTRDDQGDEWVQEARDSMELGVDTAWPPPVPRSGADK